MRFEVLLTEDAERDLEDNGNLALLPDDLKYRLAAAVAAVDLEHLPHLEPAGQPFLP